MKRKSIDGEWIRNNETKDIRYSSNSQKDSYDYLDDIDISIDWDASDLGKYTINTPTSEKNKAAEQDKKMIPISEKEFEEISDDIDPEDANFQDWLKKQEKEFEVMLSEIQS